MRYITKCAKYWGSKVGHTSKIVMSWRIVGQNRLKTRSLSGGYKMTNDSLAESEMQMPWV